jgi:hypothetical protein
MQMVVWACYKKNKRVYTRTAIGHIRMSAMPSGVSVKLRGCAE